MVEPGQGSGCEGVTGADCVYDLDGNGRLGRDRSWAERDGPVDTESHQDEARPEPSPALGDLVWRHRRIEPFQVRPTHLDQVRHADPALEPATVPVCISDQLPPDVGVETDEPRAMLTPHALLQRGC